jgi:hypothetical protein
MVFNAFSLLYLFSPQRTWLKRNFLLLCLSHRITLDRRVLTIWRWTLMTMSTRTQISYLKRGMWCHLHPRRRNRKVTHLMHPLLTPLTRRCRVLVSPLTLTVTGSRKLKAESPRNKRGKLRIRPKLELRRLQKVGTEIPSLLHLLSCFLTLFIRCFTFRRGGHHFFKVFYCHQGQ